ncbi:MAG TPA: hypothetical protein DCP92_13145 [Nitrospiraceae bacterium]|jgi:hypothetical protein|nr:hypothetical protein [Nitrospiraceae bacterium]
MAELEIPNVEELEELRAKQFTKRTALITAIFAVILAIASLGGNKSSKEMLMSQQQSSDQWAFYQAKVIREHLYRNEKLRLEADLIERGDTMKPEARSHYQTLMKKLGEEEVRYDSEKKELEQEAKKLEHERDINRDKLPYFEYAEVLLQISIVLASIAILSSLHAIFYFSVIAASLGTLLTLNGYLLLFKIPFFH